ncbi:hypothetical protein [Thalassotalea fusca]
MLSNAYRLYGVILVILTLTSCSVGNRVASHGQSVDVTMGNIDVNANNSAGHLAVTNGNITISHHAKVKSIEVLNGNITIENFSEADSIETTNGNIDIGDKVQVSHDVVTLNGDIQLATNVEIGANVRTATGNVLIGKGTRINGDIIFEKPGYWSSKVEQEIPVLEIEEGAIVEGNIHLYRPITLRIPEGFSPEQVIHHYDKRS